MKCTEKPDAESKKENTESSSPFEKCQGMAEMMRSFCGSDDGSCDCKEIMQSMFGKTPKEEEKQ
jgi:hypothetical protein